LNCLTERERSPGSEDERASANACGKWGVGRRGERKRAKRMFLI